MMLMSQRYDPRHILLARIGSSNNDVFGDVDGEVEPVSYTHLTLPTILLV